MCDWIPKNCHAYEFIHDGTFASLCSCAGHFIKLLSTHWDHKRFPFFQILFNQNTHVALIDDLLDYGVSPTTLHIFLSVS